MHVLLYMHQIQDIIITELTVLEKYKLLSPLSQVAPYNCRFSCLSPAALEPKLNELVLGFYLHCEMILCMLGTARITISLPPVCVSGVWGPLSRSDWPQI